ncbi:MAG: hypothetical protein JW751_06710 [Polyangiaceae bacterium]|nr:hypothetical protein [Polyangiaceae bacterium]
MVHIEEANHRPTAGQTAFLRAGTYADETNAPVHSGTSDHARISYTNYQDEEVTLEGSVYCVHLQGSSYVSVLGLSFLNCGRNFYLRESHPTLAEPLTWRSGDGVSLPYGGERPDQGVYEQRA